jgi:hypothetical protein
LTFLTNYLQLLLLLLELIALTDVLISLPVRLSSDMLLESTESSPS